jgi:hypothetical protein
MRSGLSNGEYIFGALGVNRHHLIEQMAQSIFPSSSFHALLQSIHHSAQFVHVLTECYWAFINPHDLCRSSSPCSPSHPWAWPNLSPNTPFHIVRGTVESQWNAGSQLAPLFLQTMIWQVSTYTSMQWTSEYDDALRGSDHVNSQIHVEANVVWTQWYTCRPSSSKCGDGHEGHNYANLVAMTKQVCRWTLTWKLYELRDALGGRYVVNIDMKLQAMIKRV